MSTTIEIIKWSVLLGFGVIFLLMAPFSRTNEQFFNAKKKDGKEPNFWLLTSSLVISWIFAKSITNSANLGLSYGIIGSIGYAMYYVSFLVAGILIYNLRTKGGFKSIHHFLISKYGKTAVAVFSLLIGIRLFNEVWSNSMVIGTYFGEQGTTNYYVSIILFTGLTLTYVLKGGLRSSLLTDLVQMIFFGLLLFILLGIVLPTSNHSVQEYMNSSVWSFENGLNLIFVALLQVFSYPFHDPVLTDRAFIVNPTTTLKSFITATIIGFICIVLFGLIGIYAKMNGLEGDAAYEVGKLLGVIPMLVMNLIMITSAASTIDSTFSSFSKLAVMDILPIKKQTVTRGRLMMILIAVVGTIPVFFNPEILSATTVSGSMVMGLAPIFLCWKIKAPKLSFHLPIWFGISIGIVLALGLYPESLLFTKGKYADLLSANLYGLIACFILFFTPILYLKWKKKQI